MSAELFNDKGPCACSEQAISINRAEVLGGNVWSCVRNNGNNAWYVNMGLGGLSYTNTVNPSSVVPASAF